MDVRLQNCFLSVDDHEKAIAFYRDALGYEVRNDVSAYGMRWVTIGPPSQPDVSVVLEPPAADPGISSSDRAAIADLLAASERVIKKADSLEDTLHNPTAEVVYDILAMHGGTRLYSRLAPLQMWAIEADGPPTEGMTQVLVEQEKELRDLEAQTAAFVSQDVAPLNATASKLGLGFVVIR